MAMDKTHSRLYLRWTVGERIQHWLLVVSFFVLVITGFALKYPESWWTWPFTITGSFDLRGLLHRIAATVYIALAVYHVAYLLLSPRGRKQWQALKWRLQDFRDLKHQILYNLGKLSRPPRYGHYTYWEKMEYWALVWGTVIMVITGLLLWFENLSLRFLPLWVLDVATVIHYYEAILATAAIFVWHFYFVIFDPLVYPLNPSMISGTLTEDAMQEEHAQELEMLSQSGINPVGDIIDPLSVAAVSESDEKSETLAV